MSTNMIEYARIKTTKIDYILKDENLDEYHLFIKQNNYIYLKLTIIFIFIIFDIHII